jgi:hypothetical protein
MRATALRTMDSYHHLCSRPAPTRRPVLVVLGDALQRVFFLGPFGTPYVVWPSRF